MDRFRPVLWFRDKKQGETCRLFRTLKVFLKNDFVVVFCLLFTCFFSDFRAFGRSFVPMPQDALEGRSGTNTRPSRHVGPWTDSLGGGNVGDG